MSKLKIRFIVTLLCFSLIGIIIFQLFWVKKAISEKKQQIRISASEIFNIVANKIDIFIDYESFIKKTNTETIDSILKSEFKKRDIYLKYEFALVSGLVDEKLLPAHSLGFTDDMISISSLKKTIALADYNGDIKWVTLYMNFPDKDKFILKSYWILFLIPFLFSLIIISTFTATIMIILRQKRISDIKTDFINNMTHEFKTPIATISLAVDAINNPKVIDDKEQIKNYTRIIKEENIRMNTHVEQVLQMSLLDKKDFNLNLQSIDMNDIVLRAIDKIKLIIDKREGCINLDLNAANTIIKGDENHLLTVLINLLDNANKYSPEKPEIIVSTKNSNNMFVV